MSEERRSSPRVAASGACTIRDADGAERPFDLVDLSECGARLTCTSPIGAMTRIQVQIVLPAERIGTDHDIGFTTLGVVVWSHKVADAHYDTGVFFPELEDEHAAVLQAYVLSAV